MKNVSALSMLLACIIHAGAAPESTAQSQWTVEQASIAFEITNAGLPVDGSFDGLVAEIRLDPDRPAEAMVVAEVSAASIKTGISLRDRHLRGRQYFDAERFPQIRMEAIRLERMSEDTFEGVFTLTIKERSREVTMPFSFVREGHRGMLEGGFTIDRRDFGLGKESMILSDEVRVILTLHVSTVSSG